MPNLAERQNVKIEWDGQPTDYHQTATVTYHNGRVLKIDKIITGGQVQVKNGPFSTQSVTYMVPATNQSGDNLEALIEANQPKG